MEDLVRHALDAMGVWSVFWLSAVGPYAFPAAGEIAIVLAAGTRSSPLWEVVVLATAGDSWAGSSRRSDGSPMRSELPATRRRGWSSAGWSRA